MHKPLSTSLVISLIIWSAVRSCRLEVMNVRILKSNVPTEVIRIKNYEQELYIKKNLNIWLMCCVSTCVQNDIVGHPDRWYAPFIMITMRTKVPLSFKHPLTINKWFQLLKTVSYTSTWCIVERYQGCMIFCTQPS